VPVVAEPGQPPSRLPCPGRVIGQQLVGDDLVHRGVQPRAERLTVGDHLFTAAECVFGVLRLDQERQFVLVGGIQKVGSNHRMLSTYLNAPASRGLMLEQLAEPRPGPEWGRVIRRGHAKARPM
jgi:hypothetical protein